MENIKIYEINAAYINYLVPYAPHLFHNRQQGQANERKYIGIVLQVNGLDYFAPLSSFKPKPLSSFKPKHRRMKEGLDFIKIKDYAVINLNNMFPVPLSECRYVNFETVRDPKYKSLLLAEYRFIKSIQEKIRKNANTLYKHKQVNGDKTPLAKRCNDFALLETKCARNTGTNSERKAMACPIGGQSQAPGPSALQNLSFFHPVTFFFLSTR